MIDRRACLLAGAAWLGDAALAQSAGLPTSSLPTASAASSAPVATASLPTPTLDRLRQRGRITMAVYQDLPPFHVDGQGIEVDLAQALAKSLDLPLSLMPFQADESMNDDLRNMVWRGHYLGHGPADLMLHVPVDAPLIQATPRARIFAPYYRERVVIARNLRLVPDMPALSAFRSVKVAVPGQSLAGWLLIGADGGALREQLITTWKDGCEAARALQRGEVAAAAGQASELESVLGRDPRFAIESLPLPRMRDGWAVGCAVKAEATDLALAVQAAVNGLAHSGQIHGFFAKAGVGWRQP